MGRFSLSHTQSCSLEQEGFEHDRHALDRGSPHGNPQGWGEGEGKRSLGGRTLLLPLDLMEQN